MSLRFDVRAHSEIGLVRKNNQDSAYAASDLLVVADGMGGAAAGDLASSVAIGEIAAMHVDLPARLAGGRPDATPEGLPAGPAGDALAALATALRQANRSIARLTLADPGLQGMGTTVCAVVLAGAESAVVNIGDSRAYLLRDGVLTRISRDHSWVQTLVDEGRISEAEALEHPHRSLILKVLNGRPQHEPDFAPLDLRAGDRVVVCSDGLCGLVTDADLAGPAGLPDPGAALAALVELARAAGGYDNITVLVGDVVEGDPTAAPAPQVLGAALTAPPLAAPPAPTGRRAVPALPIAADEQRYAPRAVRFGWLRAVGGLLVLALLVVGALAAAAAYTRTLYYVGAADAQVGLFRGVDGAVAGYPLAERIAVGPPLADLPALQRDLVERRFPVADEATGRARLAGLADDARACVAHRAARASIPVATPAPTGLTGTAPSPGVLPSAADAPSAPAASGPSAVPSTAATPPPEGC